MASAKDFARLQQINGVANYFLVHDDGQIICQDIDADPGLGAIIATCGKQCDSLTADLGGNRYIHLCLERESGNDILVFSLGCLYLGIVKHADSNRQEIIDSVIYFLKNLT